MFWRTLGEQIRGVHSVSVRQQLISWRTLFRTERRPFLTVFEGFCYGNG